MPELPSQSKSASATAVKSLKVELAKAAAAGSLLVSGVGIDKDSGTTPAPSEGWTAVNGNRSTSVSIAMAYRIADGSAKDACTWSWTTAHDAAAYIAEASGFPHGAYLAEAVNFTNETEVSSVALGPAKAIGPALALGMVAIDTADSWDSGSTCATWNEGFSEQLYYHDASFGAGGSVAWKLVEAGASVSTTPKAFSEGGKDQVSGILAVFSAASGGSLGLLGAGR